MDLNEMSDREYKVLENRLRRAADRQGLQLKKSRARDPRALTYGTYMLTDIATNAIVAGDTQNGYGLDLNDVEKALNED